MFALLGMLQTRLDYIPAEFESIPFGRTKMNGHILKYLRSFIEAQFQCFTWMRAATLAKRRQRGSFIPETFGPDSMFSKNKSKSKSKSKK